MDSTTSDAFVLMRGNETRWSSGAWNGQGFDFMPEMRLNYIFNYTMYSDENETYLSYSVSNNSLTRFLRSSGRIGQSTIHGLKVINSGTCFGLIQEKCVTFLTLVVHLAAAAVTVVCACEAFTHQRSG
ncbi:hypothetical protein F3Y22_tig00110847pilonHSYRG00307 [Hibiscus syriacus]|uniref:S-locus glycoprotein domain-containing protein n=2 Tax=Hibiscus syriacus TaxID=106335 RepID=A0A6A2ZL56_HIBSY|nr:hypothetical protein F3Y22_tig00110847pilonHSYRG00307 [Hibiscus syriacus]